MEKSCKHLDFTTYSYTPIVHDSYNIQITNKMFGSNFVIQLTNLISLS